ncbi:MAG: hypothetical protein ABR571_12135 [Jatrophihabitans sp.]|uniref:hypothetical protein n=1 Tax=Jatrophihabitans sp. TaxID=1932789 RepID=UPI00390FFE66
MTTAATAPQQRSMLPVHRLRARPDAWTLAPSLFAVVNATAFFLIRPDVNDLWAARARASAVSHGVGLTYWFSWFGGGSTPGNYSVLTPYVSAALGTELVGALSAVAVTVLITVAVRGTRYPGQAAAVGALAVGLNLWSGRVPFLLGAAFAIGVLIAVRRRSTSAAVGLTMLSILASPVSGAFVALALSGSFLTTGTKRYRAVIAWTTATVILALVTVGLIFGTPRPEPFSTTLLIKVLLALGLLLASGPRSHLRTTIWISALVAIVLFTIPNGLGSNFGRFVWFCLPVAAVALSRRRVLIPLLCVTPLLYLGGEQTWTDLRHASAPVSSVSYYTPLVDRLDGIPELRNYRVEVVDHGAHTGYDALLGHAMLARGWETQDDKALNRSLDRRSLDPVTYKVWLDNNAVGYVALPLGSVAGNGEYTLVESGTAPYLHRIWSSNDWQLFRVGNPTPIVARPASVLAHDQKSMTIDVPCACTIGVRLRWSKFLTATRQEPDPSGTGTVDGTPRVHAAIENDGSGWSTLTTSRPGTYVLRGSLRGGLRR